MKTVLKNLFDNLSEAWVRVGRLAHLVADRQTLQMRY